MSRRKQVDDVVGRISEINRARRLLEEAAEQDPELGFPPRPANMPRNVGRLYSQLATKLHHGGQLWTWKHDADLLLRYCLVQVSGGSSNELEKIATEFLARTPFKVTAPKPAVGYVETPEERGATMHSCFPDLFDGSPIPDSGPHTPEQERAEVAAIRASRPDIFAAPSQGSE